MITFLSMWLLSHFDNSSSEAHPQPTEESKEWPGYSVALHILLPVAGFYLLWGRRDLLTRLLLHIDRSCVAVCCPSFSRREKLLKWASENLPYSWSSPSKTLSGGIPDLWKDGSLLCTLINMAVPGACSNPPKHWKKPPTHAQALAYKYFGIAPVFTEKEFEAIFSPIQERKFLFYLQELEQAMKKYNAREQSTSFSLKYLAKGMGLQTAEQHRKTIFYIYANTSDSNTNNILVYLRGPYGTQGTTTIPAFYNMNSLHVLKYLKKQFRVTDKIILKKERRKSFFKSIALDISAFVNLERKVSTNDIPIQIDIEENRAKITYIPNHFGIYEVNLITNGELLAGSPFSVSVIENISGIQDSFEIDEDNIKQLPGSDRKRIISRVIDCIDEKIELTNNADETTLDEIGATIMNRASRAPDQTSPTESIDEALPRDISQYQTEDELQNVELKHGTQNEEILKSSNLISSEKTGVSSYGPSDSRIINEDQSQDIISTGRFESPDQLTSSALIKMTLNQMNNSSLNSFDRESGRIDDEEGSSVQSNGNIPTKEENSRSKFNETEKLLRGIQKNANSQKAAIVLNSRNRPTSIVSPFFKQAKFEPKNEDRSNNQDAKSSPLYMTYEESPTGEKNLFTPGISEQNSIHKIPEDSPEIETTENSLENSSIVREFAPEELLLSIRQNKISIQNEYVTNLKAILANKLKSQSDDSKRVKDFVNTTNKLNCLNNMPLTQKNVHPLPTVPNTSPICPAHIVPEVEPTKGSDFGNLSLAEKRSFFSKQSQRSNSINSSISNEENEGVSTHAGSPDSSLRILSVMDSIKKSNLSKNFSKSSPNMLETHHVDNTCPISNERKTTFQRAREYWKNMSMVNLSTESPSDTKIKFSKSKTLPVSNITKEIYKSADDISTSAKYNFGKVNLKRCLSLNQRDFEAIEFISIDERKKQLLQDKFQEENLRGRLVKKVSFTKTRTSSPSTKNVQNSTMDESEEKSETSAPFEQKKINHQEEETDKNDFGEKEKTLSGFVHAMAFFKNLEKSSAAKRKLIGKIRSRAPEIRRRLSLDCAKEKKNEPKIGGSLKLPKTSERFSITKIYFDIMKNGRGSFKGSANSRAVSATLASITTKNDPEFVTDESDICIEYNMFFNKQKTKKRKSVRSLFDIHY